MRAAHWFGLRGRAARVGIEALDRLPRASILFWQFRHFVLFDRLTKTGVRIVDPAKGAPARLRAGDRMANFPEGTFPPGLPFIPFARGQPP